MRQVTQTVASFCTLTVMLVGLSPLAQAEVAPYTPERLKAARDSAPYTAIHFLKAEAAGDMASFAETVTNDGPEAAGVRHIAIVPANQAALAVAEDLPLLVLADPDNAASGAMSVREQDLPASLIFEKGADKPMERYFERGGRTTPNIRSMNARLLRAWRHPAIGRFPLDNGVALKGMDPVSYHTSASPTAGNPAIASDYRGITYRFATADNRRRFAADPEKHLPAAGGWCAMAMARGEQVEADVNSFTVREGRLLLFYKGIYGDSREEFTADAANFAQSAAANWARIENPPANNRP